MGGRAVGVIGTLVITRFLSPDTVGEVSVAAILTMTANWITIWGFGQYYVVRGRGEDRAEVVWHSTFFYLVLGIIAIGAVAFLGGHLTPLLDAPDAAVFVPGMALSVFIRRMGAMPERILTQQMNFRPSGMSLALGEFAFTATALPLAALGWGGWSLVVANIMKSIVQVWILVAAAGFKSWCTPTKLSWKRSKDMLKFGVPLGIQGVAHMASRYWDNLAIARFFGTAPLGAYNMAYNLADIPAVQVGEQIALVLLPSIAELPPERRPRALERSTALLSLVIFPLAVGLGLIAYPLIAWILPKNDWQEVAPLLAILACLSVFRPITWVISAYMEAESKTGRLMFLEIAKVGFIVGGIGLLSPWGLHASATAVGFAFGLTALAGIAMVVRHGPSLKNLAKGFVQPLMACFVMGGAVWLTHRGLQMTGLSHPSVYVIVEIVVGAIAYVIAALVFARETSKDLLQLLFKALKR
jgi:PST family polysaccharide transporter